MKTVTTLLVVLSSFVLQAATVNCTNPDLEISCSEGRCYAAATGDFTPMSLAFTSNGSVSACAYAGCWEGEGKAAGDSRYLSIIARDLPFTPNVNPQPNLEDVVILWDRQDNIALLKLAGYAQPMQCRILQ